MSHLVIENGALDINSITTKWYEELKVLNYGALVSFVGVIRDENDIDGLSFDIYFPILNNWFDSWIEKTKKQNALIFMESFNSS